jgi:hypothetical protein
MLRTWLRIAQGKSFVSILPSANVDLISGALPFGRLWYGGPMHYQTKSATQPFQLLT